MAREVADATTVPPDRAVKACVYVLEAPQGASSASETVLLPEPVEYCHMDPSPEVKTADDAPFQEMVQVNSEPLIRVCVEGLILAPAA